MTKTDYMLMIAEVITLLEDNEPNDETLWNDLAAMAQGQGQDEITRTIGGEDVTVTAPNEGNGFDTWPSPQASAWVVRNYNRLGGDWTEEQDEPIIDD